MVVPWAVLKERTAYRGDQRGSHAVSQAWHILEGTLVTRSHQGWEDTCRLGVVTSRTMLNGRTRKIA